MTREQLQQLCTVDDLLRVKAEISTEIEALSKSLVQLRNDLASAGVVKPKRTFMTPKEFGGRVGVCERTVINWLMAGVLRGSQPNGAHTAWIIPISEIERLEREALDEAIPVRQFVRRL